MYAKDKTNRVTVRLNSEQFEYVKSAAELLDVSPSDYLRMILNLMMSADKKSAEIVKESWKKVPLSSSEEVVNK